MVKKTDLSAGWEFAQAEWLGEPPFGYTRVPGWLPATVPGSVHLDLVANGIIRHPFEGMAELGCQWVDECDWSYRTPFSWSGGAGSHRALRFDGLDTVCTIFLNGKEIGRHDNMFLPLELDVSSILVVGENELRVDFQSAVRVGRERRADYFAREGIAENVLNFDERAFVRKAQYMFGWDWGPRLVSCGIWKPVRLIEFDARIRSVGLKSSIGDNGITNLSLQTEFDGTGVTPRHILGDQQFLDGTTETFCYSKDNPKDPQKRAGIFRWEVSGREWWPAQLDEDGRALNHLITVLAEETDPQLLALQSGEDPGWPNPADPERYKDDHWLCTGLARVELRRVPDELGESFEFIVNGKPLWIRGANWIPISSFPSEGIRHPGRSGDGSCAAQSKNRLTDAKPSSSEVKARGECGDPSTSTSSDGSASARDDGRLRHLLESAQAMGMNMLRVWGGGLYESDEFYDICDELGVLIWQDFPFACSYYPDDEDFVEKIREEATYHVKRLRHHPCLALWCGNNENLTMWEGEWGGADRQPSRFHGERIWNELLRDVVAEHDPGRPYIPTSPIGSAPDQVDCNAGGFGDSHYWDVWHGRGDWVHYVDSTARFSSEFGFPSSCGRKAWSEVTDSPVHHLTLSSPTVRWHDKTGRPSEYLRDLITLHYPEPKNLDEWIYYSQLNQRDAMRCAIEHYRRSDFCTGTLIWQINDVWPVQSWSLIDGRGEWKAAGFELQRLYSSCLISLVRSAAGVEIWAINDGPAAWHSTGGTIHAFDTITGDLRAEAKMTPFEIEAGTRGLVHRLDTRQFDPKRTWVGASDASAAAHTYLTEPKDLLLPEALPIHVSYWAHPQPLLRVHSRGPVFELFLYDDGGNTRFGQNFIQLGSAPFASSVQVDTRPVSLKARSLAGMHEIEILPA